MLSLLDFFPNIYMQHLYRLKLFTHKKSDNKQNKKQEKQYLRSSDGKRLYRGKVMLDSRAYECL